MTKEEYSLNDEQWNAVSTKSVATIVNASAGSGKTRCLTAKIRYLLDSGVQPRNILSMTFTNKAANEMKERIKVFCPYIADMQVSTIHSMSVRIIKTFAKHTPLKIPFSIYDDSDQLSIIKTLAKSRGVSDDPYDIQAAISKAKSEDTIDESFKEIQKAYQDILIKNNACDFDDLLLYSRNCLKKEDCHAHYSNLWQHILVDEFQDTSTVQYEIVNLIYDQNKTKTLFVVGDENQCVIEGTNISILNGSVPIETLHKSDPIMVGYGNSYKKETLIDEIHTSQVTNIPVITIETEKGYKLTTTLEHIHFAGFYKQSPATFFTYLMYKKDLGYRVGTTKLIIDKKFGGRHNLIYRFKHRLSQERADAMWFLGAYKTEREARYFEQYYSIKYSLPTWVFYTKHLPNLSYNNDMVQKLFKSIDTEYGAKKLLTDLNLFFNYPHHRPHGVYEHRDRNFNIYLCGSNRKTVYKGKNRSTHFSNISHCYSISGSNPEDKKTLEKMGLKTRLSKDRKGYRIEGICSDLRKIYELTEKIKKVMDINVIEKGRFSHFSLPMIPASHVLPGMVCFVEDNGNIISDIITKTEKNKYTGKIYDLNTNRYHNYIANGIVTHNSIYGWRSAKPENMNDFIKRYNPSIQYLTYNYRSSPEIISHANNYLQFGKSMVAKTDTKGTVTMAQFKSQEDEAELISQAIQKMSNYEETAIIYRVNSRSILFERALAMKRIPYKVVGDIPFYRRRVSKDLLSYCKAAMNPQDMESLIRIVNVPKRGFGDSKQEKLLNEGWPYLHEMAKIMPSIDAFIKILEGIRNKKPLQAIEEVIFKTGYRDSLQNDSDRLMLGSFLNVVAGFNSLEELILTSSFLEEDSGRGVKLMTAHASKGLEFNKVFVVGVENGVWPHALSENIEEENRLYYVACTRSKHFLNISYSRSKLYRGIPIPILPSDLYKKSLGTI